MAQQDPHTIPWPLISAVLSGEANPGERKALQSWRSAHPENEARYREAERLWLMSGKTGTDVLFDSQADWPAVARKANISAPRIWWQAPVMRWAAVIVLLAAIGGILWQVIDTSPTQWKQVVATTQPVEHTLPDGSLVVVRTGGSFAYPEPFSDQERNIRLEGEAWFDVARDTTRPFIITGSHVAVKVLGTSFMVQDHPADSIAQVDVASGKVRVRAGTDSLEITAGQSSRLINQQLTTVPQNPYFLAWKEQRLAFDDVPITEVLPALSRYYQRSFRSEGDMAGLRLTARFTTESIDEVMEVLRITLGVTVEQQTNEVVLSKN